MLRVDDYRTWWPWLRACDAAAVEPGARWTCVVQPPLPYAVRFQVTLDEVQAGRRASATIDGDITGTASIDLTAADDGSEIRLVSALAPSNALLRAVAMVARPIAVMGHDWVMDTGLRQFRARALPTA
jgi:hypothetical protein